MQIGGITSSRSTAAHRRLKCGFSRHLIQKNLFMVFIIRFARPAVALIIDGGGPPCYGCVTTYYKKPPVLFLRVPEVHTFFTAPFSYNQLC